MFLSWKIMRDYFSAEGYNVLDNENFPLSLLHFCNLSFQKFEIFHLHAKYQESWSNASLLPLYFFVLCWLEFCFDAFQKHFPRHIYKSWLILPQLPPMRTWRPFCIQKSAKNRWPQNLWRTYAHEYKVCMLTSSVISAQAFLFLFLVLHAFSLKNLSPFFSNIISFSMKLSLIFK